MPRPLTTRRRFLVLAGLVAAFGAGVVGVVVRSRELELDAACALVVWFAAGFGLLLAALGVPLLFRADGGFLRNSLADEGPSFDPDASIEDAACVECGYDLVGLTCGSVCPECGTPAHESLLHLEARHDGPLHMGGRRYVLMLLSGCQLVLVAVGLLTFVWVYLLSERYFLDQLFTDQYDHEELARHLLAMSILFGLPLGVIGMGLLTVRQKRAVEPAGLLWWRWSLRIVTVLYLPFLIASIVVLEYLAAMTEHAWALASVVTLCFPVLIGLFGIHTLWLAKRVSYRAMLWTTPLLGVAVLASLVVVVSPTLGEQGSRPGLMGTLVWQVAMIAHLLVLLVLLSKAKRRAKR